MFYDQALQLRLIIHKSGKYYRVPETAKKVANAALAFPGRGRCGKAEKWKSEAVKEVTRAQCAVQNKIESTLKTTKLTSVHLHFRRLPGKLGKVDQENLNSST